MDRPRSSVGRAQYLKLLKMKKLIVIFIIIVTLSSCASLYYKDYRLITDYSERISLVQDNFPEIYNLYRSGDVIIDEVFEYTDKNTGKERVHISYHYR